MSNKKVTYQKSRNTITPFEPVLEIFKVNEKLKHI